ncbi:MAG: hypothetical protein A2099_03270 [Planctomycetes bacterium GWF2_39_10]|nr:MAG: hypothetical protein A2099_03270 [Planctomycetes bacterium GWF2_39_10]
MIDHLPSARQKAPDADTSAPERQIDQMVYKLYDLTPRRLQLWRGRNENLLVCLRAGKKNRLEKARTFK